MAYISGTIYVAQTNTRGYASWRHTCYCRKPIIVLYPQGGCNGLGNVVAIYGDRSLTCELYVYMQVYRKWFELGCMHRK